MQQGREVHTVVLTAWEVSLTGVTRASSQPDWRKNDGASVVSLTVAAPVSLTQSGVLAVSLTQSGRLLHKVVRLTQ